MKGRHLLQPQFTLKEDSACLAIYFHISHIHCFVRIHRCVTYPGCENCIFKRSNYFSCRQQLLRLKRTSDSRKYPVEFVLFEVFLRQFLCAIETQSLHLHKLDAILSVIMAHSRRLMPGFMWILILICAPLCVGI